MKRARFNAAKRYERKHSASTIAFAIAGIVGFLVPFYSLLFRDVLTVHTKNVLDFTAFVIGALSLTLGLIEQARDYPDKARSFNLCGRRVNSVARRLTTSPTMHDDQLQELVTQYEAALEECADNHDDIDYEIAKAQEEIAETQGPAKREATKRLWKLRWLERLQIYWLYGATWVCPLFIGILLWIFAPVPPT